ncbi:leucyl aminopeptidase [Rubripirellula sp.]|jgi:leucyl aminopeptidase|nr:leucyl aminopeptidase [Rubripirellula sp.]MDB4634224.1 leucyl aminopeptidase [Rubripirellula sp.]MDC0288352.1 leucyl aminopeptidase [Rubripirellula sp.]
MLDSNPIPSPELLTVTEILEQKSDVLVVGLTEEGSLSSTLDTIDNLTGGWVKRLAGEGEIRGKTGELTLLASPANTGPRMLLIVGLGSGELDRELAFESGAMLVRRLGDRQRETVVVALAESFPPTTHDALVAGALSGCEQQAIYQSDPALRVPEKILFYGVSEESLQRGCSIGESINQTRRLVNEPPAVIFPESFAEKATSLFEGSSVIVEVWDEQRLIAEGCRAILAVGAGSSKSPRLLILRYNGGGSEKPLALVGKGVTFDSGGLSLKPSAGMLDMKCDMAGAATVVGAMHGIAKLGLKRNVIGFCGLAENMVSGDSYKLGDVIETRSGKTIEIHNTDAEGRVVLADTLDVAIQHEPRAMVDLATLTGACMVALGTDIAGLMTNDQRVCDEIQAAAGTEGEPVWQLPMFDLFDEKVKSKVADIKNVGEGRWGGAITAAKFLENFVGDVPWVHIDIAGPAFADGAKPSRDAGATGVMVRSLIRWVENSDI